MPRDQSILQPGRNCWRVEHARRAVWLIDAEDYFRVLRDAIGRAQRSVIILGWDIDSRVQMVRDGEPGDRLPSGLGGLLRRVAEDRGVRVDVLLWDFALFYALDREWLPIYRLGGASNGRINVHMDSEHPTGASHHQKVVVIDDKVAFVGGIDVTRNRWDSRRHEAGDPRRVDFRGSPYIPYHDLQWMVEGEIAAALGEMARERWLRATGERVPAPARPDRSAWPDNLQADLEGIEIGIARTEPEHRNRSQVREIEQLYLDAVRVARRVIYIENQYVTSKPVGEALAARLAERFGPEIVIVGPLRTEGWLAQHTMDVLRGRLLRRLRDADKYGRLFVYHPVVPDLSEGEFVKVHSKLLVVDDRLLLCGSANLSDRSFRLDTECNLALDSGGDPGLARAIEGLRNRLLAEHLDLPESEVAGMAAHQGSPGRAIESLRGDGRTLVVLEGAVDPNLDEWVPETELLDPTDPWTPQNVADYFLPERPRRHAGRPVIAAAALLALLAALAAAWRWTPAGEWIDLPVLVETIGRLREQQIAPLLVFSIYLLGGLVMLPVTLLIVATCIVFGPKLGFVYSLVGAVLSSILGYALGWVLRERTMRRLDGSRFRRLSRWLERRGILTVVAIRMIPVAPFTIVNMLAGASRIRLRDYALGTALGMTPGILALSLFADRLDATIQDPTPGQFLILFALVAAIVLSALALRRWLRRREAAGTRSRRRP